MATDPKRSRRAPLQASTDPVPGAPPPPTAPAPPPAAQQPPPPAGQQAPPGYWQASDGNWYPPQGQGPPQQPKKRGGCLKWGGIGLAAVIVIAIIAAAAGGGEDKKSGKAGGDDGGSGREVFAVGDTAHTGDFDVTLHTVEDPFVPTNEFETPAAGQRLVAVEMTFANTSDENLPLSTLLGFEVKDSENRAWNITIAGTDLPQIDGDVPPGEARRGWAVFAVAEDATDLKLRVKGNVTATGSVFQL